MKKISEQLQFWSNVVTILVVLCGAIGFFIEKGTKDPLQDERIAAIAERQDYQFEVVNKRLDRIENKLDAQSK